MGMLRVVAQARSSPGARWRPVSFPGDARPRPSNSSKASSAFYAKLQGRGRIDGRPTLPATSTATTRRRHGQPDVDHAPDMWAGMKQRGIVKASCRPESASDLFAYFVSARLL